MELKILYLCLQLLEFKKPVIITGAALGGSIASLFTLWLLEKVEPKLKRPLCITFGSPFIGDAKLQQILENSVRNSCFLHVADATQTPTTEGFKPFGTYLICNGSGCDCIDDPKAVMGLLLGGGTDLQGWRDYGEVLKSLDRYLQWRMCLNRKQCVGRIHTMKNLRNRFLRFWRLNRNQQWRMLDYILVVAILYKLKKCS